MNESRNQHFVPQSILRNFTYDEACHLYCYDKWNKRTFSNTIENIGSENDYNNVVINGVKHNYEHIFDKFDSMLSDVVKLIGENEDLRCLDDNQFSFLYYIFLVQLQRSPLVRSTFEKISRQMLEMLEEFGLDPNDSKLKDEYIIDTDHAKALSIKAIVDDYSDLLEPIKDRPIILLRAVDNRIISSDNSVVMYSHSPYEIACLKSEYVEINIPISSRLVLSLLPEKVLGGLSIPEIQNTYSRRIRDAIYNRSCYDIDHSNVLFLNSLQVSNARRFIYSSYDCSHFVESIIIENPALQKIESSIFIGNHGPNKRVKKDDHIVIWIDSNYIEIKLISFESDTEQLLITIERKNRSLKIFDIEIDKISVFKEQIEVVMMRHVKIEVLKYKRGVIVCRICHYDFQLGEFEK